MFSCLVGSLAGFPIVSLIVFHFLFIFRCRLNWNVDRAGRTDEGGDEVLQARAHQPRRELQRPFRPAADRRRDGDEGAGPHEAGEAPEEAGQLSAVEPAEASGGQRDLADPKPPSELRAREGRGATEERGRDEEGRENGEGKGEGEGEGKERKGEWRRTEGKEKRGDERERDGGDREGQSATA